MLPPGYFVQHFVRPCKHALFAGPSALPRSEQICELVDALGKARHGSETPVLDFGNGGLCAADGCLFSGQANWKD